MFHYYEYTTHKEKTDLQRERYWKKDFLKELFKDNCILIWKISPNSTENSSDENTGLTQT
jgi:hypothetical protein